jgi:hypothetical protein
MLSWFIDLSMVVSICHLLCYKAHIERKTSYIDKIFYSNVCLNDDSLTYNFEFF